VIEEFDRFLIGICRLLLRPCRVVAGLRGELCFVCRGIKCLRDGGLEGVGVMTGI